ncbi:hypothetical protein SLS58_001962 [Diplodia intermedia]|uniref:Peptidase A2 domain-containing protein n=1 Tax=Diplodia intermedia TaxID=856260 RepID=A0ABR3U0C7_9PEZI
MHATQLRSRGRVEGPSITSVEPLRSFSPSHDDSVDAIAIDPSDDLSLTREDEATNALQFLDQHNSTPETLHLPLTGEADQNNITQIVNQLEEDGGTVDVGDRGSPDNLNLDSPQGHIESAEQDTPPLLERNEDEGESGLHNLAPEDPAEQQGIPVVDETELVAIESPVTSKDVDVSTVDEKYPLDHGADPGLDNLILDVSGTEDLDDPVYHHDRSSNQSSDPCELDYNLDGPVEQIGLIQDEANAEVDSMCQPSEVTDSSSSSAAEFEKEVYFYSAGRADKTLLYALLDTGADRNFIRLDKAEAAGLELRPCAHLNFWAGDGSVVRPKYVARGARWRFVHKGGGIIWTDEFVVLEHMPRDVILGNGVIVKRSFLLSNETLCVLGLQALTLTKEERRKREEEEKRKRLSDQERIKQQNLETRQQIIEKRQKKKLLQPKPEDNKDTEDEWYDCEEDSSIVATVGSRP